MLIDPKSHMPIFQQIATHLRKRIQDGVYRSGEALPSLRAMAVDIQVNPNTVQRAYEVLEREGVVESRRGVGMFVSRIDRRRQSRDEKRVGRELTATIRSAIDAGLAPERIRQVFDQAMAEFVREAAKS